MLAVDLQSIIIMGTSRLGLAIFFATQATCFPGIYNNIIRLVTTLLLSFSFFRPKWNIIFGSVFVR